MSAYFWPFIAVLALGAFSYFASQIILALQGIGRQVRQISLDLDEIQYGIERIADTEAEAVRYVKQNVEINQERWDLDKQFVWTPEEAAARREEEKQQRVYESEALDSVLRGLQVAFSKGVEALLHRLDAIAEALDDKKVRVMNVPAYSAPQNPAPAPQIGPNTSIRADDPRIQTLFGQVQAAGKEKRRLEAESEALRERIAAEKARLEQVTALRTDPGRRAEDQEPAEAEESAEKGEMFISDTAFDDVMRRINAQKDRQ